MTFDEDLVTWFKIDLDEKDSKSPSTNEMKPPDCPRNCTIWTREDQILREIYAEIKAGVQS